MHDNRSVVKAHYWLNIIFILCISEYCIANYSVFYQTGQQKNKITGRVSDEENNPIGGASIFEKDTPNGVISDMEGYFSIMVSPGAILEVSFLGYEKQTVIVGGKAELNIVLKESALLLDNVVVTALGIKKQWTSLPYSATKIKGDELLKVKNPNMIIALTGKDAGVQINKNASGIGGSARILIRGNRTVASDNQPLFVIDGVPISNSSNEQAYSAIGGVANSGNRDGGDGISNLNPEDIESMTVLKGAPAAALYGSQAANGVILITTKKGNTETRQVTFTTSLNLEKAFCLPEFQNKYGVSDGIESWGGFAEMPAYDNAGDFFRTGVTSMTGLSVSAGTKNHQNYFSYANTIGNGVVPENRLSRHNLNFRETSELFGGMVKLDGNINLMRQNVKNRPASGGFYMNPLVGLYRFPRGKNIREYKDNFEVYDESRNLNVQNWHSDTQDFEQNPYWIVNRIQSKDTRTRTIASLTANININSWLKIQARGSTDYINDKLRQKFYATTAPALSGENGRYVEYDYTEYLMYGDVMGLAEKKFLCFSINAALGGSITDKNINSTRIDSKTASLKYANVFNIANVNMNSSADITQRIDARRQIQSVFATAQLGYRESLYIELTARNDWSSTLAYTSHEKKGYFYPSVGGTWVIGELLHLPDFISFAKIRGAWSKVGSDIPLNITHSAAHQSAGGTIQDVDAAVFEDEEMKPEMTTSIEFGTEWRFCDNRLGINLTYYRTNTKNQFFKLPAKSGDRYAYRYVNAGNIRNCGVEIKLNTFPVFEEKWIWKSDINFSANRNKVLKLHDELLEFIYGPRGFSSSYAMKLREGGSFGDIYGKAFLRDEKGNIVYETEGDRKGLPKITGDGNTIKVGNSEPKFMISWNNGITYKNFDLSFLVDCRIGGDILSQTQADMDMFGVTEATAKARDAGRVWLEGHQIENVKGFYKYVVGGRNGVTEYYMYDATNIRLRELSVGCKLPSEWMEKSKVFKNVHLSFVARNLFFIYKKAPFDPDLVLSTGNDNQGIEVYGMPTTRSMGFNLRCEF